MAVASSAISVPLPPSPPSPPVPEPVITSKFNISMTIRDDGSLLINSTRTTASSDPDDDDTDHGRTAASLEHPKTRKQQRSHSQRSNKSNRTPLVRSNDMDDTSDDEAFMNNEDNFVNSPRPLRRSLRKRKTSSLKRRPGVQTVPEMRKEEPQHLPEPEIEVSAVGTTIVTSLDDTVEELGDLSLQWIENDYPTSTSSATNYRAVSTSERSFIIANAETEDALSDGGDFKIPYPVSYRQNLSKRKLVVESDEEFISKTFRAPVKRSCIRYFC